MSRVPNQLPEFRDRALLLRALTHRSRVNESDIQLNDNERLEFLGDAILSFICGAYLYRQFPTKTEGELTVLRSLLVDSKQLAEFAKVINLGSQIQLGKGAERDGGRSNPKILSSTFEALVGAYFLDQNSEIVPVQQYVLPFFADAIAQIEQQHPEVPLNYKSHFQEWAQAEYGENPEYVLIAAAGPDHAKTFVSEVHLRGKSYGRGTGSRKQDAEKDAARDALDRLGLLNLRH